MFHIVSNKALFNVIIKNSMTPKNKKMDKIEMDKLQHPVHIL
jgi:hypothetical protein